MFLQRDSQPGSYVCVFSALASCCGIQEICLPEGFVFSHVSFFQLENQPQQIPELKLLLTILKAVPPGSLENRSFYHIFIKILLNISKFQDLIRISISYILFSRINFPSSLLVLKFGHIFESPLELLKVLMPKPHPRELKSEIQFGCVPSTSYSLSVSQLLFLKRNHFNLHLMLSLYCMLEECLLCSLWSTLLCFFLT